MPLSSFSYVVLLSCVFLLIIDSSNSQQYEGDACTANGSPGVCKILRQCAPVYNELLAGRPPSGVCGYANFEPIVCCPNDDGLGTRSTSTTTTTTTTQAPTTTVRLTGRGAIARAKCQQYRNAIYQLQPSYALGLNQGPVNISLCSTNAPKYIVGGKKADPKEFPHMAAVGYDGKAQGLLWLCGGTLISERFVLTAAHCTYSTSWGPAVFVRLGDLNLANDADDARPQNIRISQSIMHPKYKQPTEYHDIGLLRLETDVGFNAWIRPACLPYSFPDTGTEGAAIATGWGRVDWTDDEGSEDLLKVTLELVAQPQCNKTFLNGGSDDKLPLGVVGDWQLCAGKLGKDTCQGDSGGPLAIHNAEQKCMYSVIGVTSLGRLCGSIIPGLYTRVYNYVPWIESVVWPELRS